MTHISGARGGNSKLSKQAVLAAGIERSSKLGGADNASMSYDLDRSMMITRSTSLLIALVGIGSAGAAEACRCVRSTPAAAYRQASAVMIGTVRAVQDQSAYDRAYRIDVERSWKRQLKGVVSINSTRSSCLADLRPGQKYLIYVVRDPAGTLRTSACQGNQPADAAGPALAWLAGRK